MAVAELGSGTWFLTAGVFYTIPEGSWYQNDHTVLVLGEGSPFFQGGERRREGGGRGRASPAVFLGNVASASCILLALNAELRTS